MRFRLRGPDGQYTLSLPDDTATVAELKQLIQAQTGLEVFDLKYGYPPKKLLLDQHDPSTKIVDAGVHLNGEQLILTEVKNEKQVPTPAPTPTGTTGTKQRSKKNVQSDDPPEIPSPEHQATVVLRIMPDDNSCLFRATGSALLGTMDTMTELRSIIAQTIQQQPDEYNAVVLERSPDSYCRWIQTERAWGGAIELSILSKHFDIEICSIDVQTLRVDRFNEGRPSRCIVVYSGIHYDVIALSPSDAPHTHAYAPAEFDTRVFDAADPLVLDRALELCAILKQKHYYTDTSGFRVRCNVCGSVFVGEKGATEHAEKTGHADFGETA